MMEDKGGDYYSLKLDETGRRCAMCCVIHLAHLRRHFSLPDLFSGLLHANVLWLTPFINLIPFYDSSSPHSLFKKSLVRRQKFLKTNNKFGAWNVYRFLGAIYIGYILFYLHKTLKPI